MPDFLVVGRAASALYFPIDVHFLVRDFPSPFGRVDVLFQTRRTAVTGMEQPLPRGLWVEVRGHAPSLTDALTAFPQIAQNLTVVLTITANAPTEDIVPELGIDVTDGVTERAFFQQFLFDEPLLPFIRPVFPVKQAKTVLGLLANHAEMDRLHRAMAQYDAALRYWFLGGEIMALGHLYMGMEVMTPVAIRRLLAEGPITTRDDIAAIWGVEAKRLDSEARRRLLFEGDDITYASAKKASDGFEHGFLPFQSIREHAIATKNATARYLRKSILNYLGLEPQELDTLLSPPFAEIPILRVDKYIFGTLTSTASNPAAPDQMYPILQWKSTATGLSIGPDGASIITFEETITPKLAEGTTFTPARFEVWGGPGVKSSSEIVNTPPTETSGGQPVEN